MRSQAVKDENRRLRAYLEELNAAQQGIAPPPRVVHPDEWYAECSICRTRHPNDDRHPCE